MRNLGLAVCIQPFVDIFSIFPLNISFCPLTVLYPLFLIFLSFFFCTIYFFSLLFSSLLIAVHLVVTSTKTWIWSLWQEIVP